MPAKRLSATRAYGRHPARTARLPVGSRRSILRPRVRRLRTSTTGQELVALAFLRSSADAGIQARVVMKWTREFSMEVGKPNGCRPPDFFKFLTNIITYIIILKLNGQNFDYPQNDFLSYYSLRKSGKACKCHFIA